VTESLNVFGNEATFVAESDAVPASETDPTLPVVTVSESEAVSVSETDVKTPLTRDAESVSALA